MTVETLIAAIVAMSFHLAPAKARVHVEAATAAATPELPVELLLSVAYVESRFDERALSRIECSTPDTCARKTGVWAKSTPPANTRGSWYCGPLQSGGYVPWRECQRMRRDVAYGYAAGTKELMIWLNSSYCKKLEPDDRLRCALAGHNGGNASAANFRRSKYAKYVLHVRNRIAKFVAFAEQKATQPQI